MPPLSHSAEPQGRDQLDHPKRCLGYQPPAREDAPDLLAVPRTWAQAQQGGQDRKLSRLGKGMRSAGSQQVLEAEDQGGGEAGRRARV